MKQLLVNIFFLVFFLNVTAQKKVYFDKDWNETDATNAQYYRTTEKQKALFLIKDYYISGQLQFEAFSTIPNDPLHHEGTVTWYHENGVIAQQVEFKDNKKNGAFLLNYENGNAKVRAYYVNDLEEGKLTEHFPSGDVGNEAFFINGKLDGTHSRYKYDGTLRERINYKNGLEHGSYEFYTSGRLLYKGNAENGFPEGKCMTYHYGIEEPEKVYTIKNRKLHGTYLEYDERGTKIVEAFFEEGIPQTYMFTRVISNDKVYKIELKLIDGVEHWKAFKNDQLLVASFYKKGIRTDIWKLYDSEINKFVLTADFTNAVCDDGYVQEVTKFEKDFSLSNRFKSLYNFTRKPCANVKFENIVESNLSNSILNEYEEVQSRNAEGIKVIESVDAEEEEVEETVIEYSESNPQKRICTTYKDYLKTVACVQTNNNIKYTLFTGEDGKSLKIIKAQDKPQKNELFIFYQDEYERVDPANIYIAFSIPNKLKAAIKKGKISKQEIINFFRTDLISYTDVTDERLLEILEEELKK
ncbi:hypothetical protein IMCC3317_11840 [Kordia antarctica]|uniref:Antitoxin YwqK n=1 Tax=Kordia antarctica TaxID=1218801 RepID=A0A7L4ZHZ7_9FLAO|nr:hypothetical protein [Kordia antarctica]QHI35836.1 hypothetical protein IMCC3317_11840 [Kordia antarctica]